jgi:PPM family protein phosphatase
VTGARGRLEVTAATNLGRRRPSNEDAIVVGNWFGFGDVASHATVHGTFAGFLLAVADGLGGHRGGAVASRMVVEGLAARASDLETGRSDSVSAAIMAIDDDIRLRATSDTSLSGMGSTLAMAVISANALKVVNVGDSRIYLSRNFDELTQISIDDVPAIPKSEDGVSGTTARRQSHRITQALGGQRLRRSPLRPHIHDIAISMPWTLLLCSDGLTDYVDEATMKERVASPSCSATDLIELALAGGGGDNVSAVLARCS